MQFVAPLSQGGVDFLSWRSGAERIVTAARSVHAMRTVSALMLLLACTACRPDHKSERRDGTPAVGESSPLPSRLSTLTGLYESGPAKARSVLCIIGRPKTSRFGLVVRASGSRICSGSGSVTRQGSGITFRMAGDSTCTMTGRISDRTILFPKTVPSGCAYYCGAKGGMAGVRLTQVGATARSALAARDLVGEPLCGED
jgi:hypothetical protein